MEELVLLLSLTTMLSADQTKHLTEHPADGLDQARSDSSDLGAWIAGLPGS